MTYGPSQFGPSFPSLGLVGVKSDFSENQITHLKAYGV